MARRKTSTPKNNSKAAQTEAASKNDPRVLADIPEGITVRPGETIIEAGLSEELSFSFMDYAMAVIVSRALPDAADGLKPVQRRILWAMYKSGSRPGGKFSKSAGHVGETMGKYHPHGDCLDGDTRIASVDGTRPTLRELTEHGVDEVDVWATDRNGNLVPARAHSFRIGQYADTVYSIHLADGSEVRATANHPFRSVTGEWVKAENLKIGDLLTSARIEGAGDVERHGDHNGFNNHPENLQVVDIEIEALEEPEPMFDFTVDDYENLHIVTSENDGVEQLLCVHNSAIYATMVRLAQDFNNNLPFVDGQGNFGSLDDSAAAPRYTEARLADASMAALADIDEDVVDFIPNYDGTRQEPKVLPMRIPTLLVNGATGIAVGMATNIAPHNLTEVAEAAKHILWNPKATPDELRQYVTGPDFPSGGTVLGGASLDEAYRTGKGSVAIRGRSRVVTEGRRTNIVIDELPYQIGAEKFITAVVEEVEKGRIDGIRDISDHSDRNTGLRVVIELKAGVDPEAVLALLHKHTPLEQRFSIQQVALVGGEPRLLNLAELLSVWVEHQLDVVVRRTRHRHGKAQERIHIVEGLIVALDNIDEVVAVIKKSQNPDTARRNLKKAIGVDDTQAGYIIDMPLRRLTSLETKKLRDEAKELAAEIKRLAKVLKSNKAQRQLVADELDAWVQQLGWERRSRVVDEWETLEVPASVETEDGPCYVTLTHSGLIGRDEGGRRQLGSDDILAAELAGTTRGMVYLTDQRGETHRIPGYVIPAASGRSRGTRPSQFLDMAASARLVGGWTDTDLEAGRIPAVITRSGVVKLVNPDTLASRGETQQIINLDDGDEIVWVGAVGREDELWFITQAGQVLRTAAAPIRPQGRNAGGVAGIKLSDDDQVIAAGSTNADNVGGAAVVVATDGGRLKATPADEYPAKGRAGMGVRSIRLLKGETRLVAAAVAAADRWVVGAAKTVAALDRADYVAKRDASGTPVPDGAAVEVIGNARP